MQVYNIGPFDWDENKTGISLSNLLNHMNRYLNDRRMDPVDVTRYIRNSSKNVNPTVTVRYVQNNRNIVLVHYHNQGLNRYEGFSVPVNGIYPLLNSARSVELEVFRGKQQTKE